MVVVVVMEGGRGIINERHHAGDRRSWARTASAEPLLLHGGAPRAALPPSPGSQPIKGRARNLPSAVQVQRLAVHARIRAAGTQEGVNAAYGAQVAGQ